MHAGALAKHGACSMVSGPMQEGQLSSKAIVLLAAGPRQAVGCFCGLTGHPRQPVAMRSLSREIEPQDAQMSSCVDSRPHLS
jgi:hypothetical protein